MQIGEAAQAAATATAAAQLTSDREFGYIWQCLGVFTMRWPSECISTFCRCQCTRQTADCAPDEDCCTFSAALSAALGTCLLRSLQLLPLLIAQLREGGSRQWTARCCNVALTHTLHTACTLCAPTEKHHFCCREDHSHFTVTRRIVDEQIERNHCSVEGVATNAALLIVIMMVVVVVMLVRKALMMGR